jgi:O-antigen/teichoic acid export membrane protein
MPTDPPPARSLFRNIAQSSGIYSAALVAQRMASLVLLPIMTRRLTTADYGMLDLLEQIGVVLGILFGEKFSLALGYYYFGADGPEGRRQVVGTGIIGAGLIGVAAALLCAPFSRELSQLVFGNPNAAPYVLFTCVLLAPSFLLEALFCWLRVANRTGTFLMGSLLRLGVTASGIVLLVGLLRLKAWGVLWTGGATIVLTSVVLTAVCLRSERPTFSRRMFVRMARYAAPIGLTGAAMFVINVGDRFVLPHYRSMSELGAYVLAYKFGMMLTFVYSPFQNFWSAQVFQIVKREDAEDVFARLSTYVWLGLSFCAVFLVVSVRGAMTVLATPEFRGASALVPLIVAAYFLRSISDFLRCLFLAAGRPGCDAVSNTVGAAVCLAGYFILIPRYGIWGAAWATLLGFSAVTVMTAVWTYRLRPYRVEGVRLLKVLLASAGALVPYALIRAESLPIQIASAVLSMAVFMGALWMLRFATPGEFRALQSFVESFTRRFRPAGAR